MGRRQKWLLVDQKKTFVIDEKEKRKSRSRFLDLNWRAKQNCFSIVCRGFSDDENDLGSPLTPFLLSPSINSFDISWNSLMQVYLINSLQETNCLPAGKPVTYKSAWKCVVHYYSAPIKIHL